MLSTVGNGISADPPAKHFRHARDLLIDHSLPAFSTAPSMILLRINQRMHQPYLLQVKNQVGSQTWLERGAPASATIEIAERSGDQSRALRCGRVTIGAAALKATFSDPQFAEAHIEQAVLDALSRFFCMLQRPTDLKAHRITEAIEVAGEQFGKREGHDALIARLDRRICDIRDTLETDDAIYSSVAKAAFPPLDEFSIVPSE